MRAAITALAMATSMLGCDATAICLPMTQPSVTITVLSGDSVVEPDEVLYSVDGGDTRPATCSYLGAGPCSSWVTDDWSAGTFVITVVGCGTEVTETVVVERGECGPVAQAITVELPGPC